MKKITLIMALMLTLNIDSYAYEVSKKVSIPRTTSPLDNIQNKIDHYNDYLKNLPIEIQNTINMLKTKKSEGNKAQAMVLRLESTFDKCFKNELDIESRNMCNLLSSTSIASIISQKKIQIKNAISFIETRLTQLKQKDKNKVIIQEGIKSLEDAKAILLGDI